MLRVNNITIIRTIPNASGFYECRLKPLSGKSIEAEFSAGALLDMQAFPGNSPEELLESHTAPAKSVNEKDNS